MPSAPGQKLKRNDLRALSDLRVEEAQHLIGVGKFAGAYHLLGVAIECALKACIAKNTEQYEFPHVDYVKASWVHNLDKLLNVAGLLGAHKQKSDNDPEFAANWLTVKDWDVDSRYRLTEEQTAKDLFEAATDPNHGVIPWIKENW